MTNDNLRGMGGKVDALIARYPEMQATIGMLKAGLWSARGSTGCRRTHAEVHARPVHPKPQPPARIALSQPPYVVRRTLDVIGTSGGKATVEQITIVAR